MRAKRGKLATVEANGRTFVLWPQPERPNGPRTEPNRSPVRDDALVAHLEDEIRFLRQQLDQQTRIAAVLTQRLLEIPADAASVRDAPQDANPAPLRGDMAETTQEPLRLASDRLALGWRRWWRRVRGEG